MDFENCLQLIVWKRTIYIWVTVVYTNNSQVIEITITLVTFCNDLFCFRCHLTLTTKLISVAKQTANHLFTSVGQILPNLIYRVFSFLLNVQSTFCLSEEVPLIMRKPSELVVHFLWVCNRKFVEEFSFCTFLACCQSKLLWKNFSVQHWRSKLWLQVSYTNSVEKVGKKLV